MRNIEKVIGKQFVDGDLPTPKDICTKQLFKAIAEIEKVDVDEEQIAPFMNEINRHFEYVDKEDILKKIVSREFGRFLRYYADAPEIVKPTKENRKAERQERKKGNAGRRPQAGPHKAEAGYRRLFINLGKTDGFYPGELMQFMNRHVRGRQEVGHIDLLSKFCYFDVPEQDAQRVMRALDGTTYKGRQVRCNDADDTDNRNGKRQTRRDKWGPKEKTEKGKSKGKRRTKTAPDNLIDEDTDWRKFFK